MDLVLLGLLASMFLVAAGVFAFFAIMILIAIPMFTGYNAVGLFIIAILCFIAIVVCVWDVYYVVLKNNNDREVK